MKMRLMAAGIWILAIGIGSLFAQGAPKDTAKGKSPESKSKVEISQVAEKMKSDSVSSAKPSAVESKMRLAVVDFACVNTEKDFAAGLTEISRSRLEEVGLYTVLTGKEMASDAEALKRKIPAGCVDERCLLRIGKILNLSKVVGGEISNDGKMYAVKLVMVDAISGKTQSKVWIASACSQEQVQELVRIGVLRLHGQKAESLSVAVQEYKGPEFSRYPQWLMTAGATAAGALAYALIDGSLGGSDKNDSIPVDRVATGEGIESSGIPGAFLAMGLSARAHGLGNAYTAVADDAEGIFWNPAGLARIRKNDLALSYLRTVVQVPYVNASYASHFSRTGAFGAALLHSGDAVYGETEFISSCAKLFDSVHPSLRPFALGANFKIRMSSTGTGGTGIDRSSGTSFGLGLDAGMQFELADHIVLGIMARDFAAWQQYRNTFQDSSYSEGVPATFTLGGAFTVSPTTLLVADGMIPLLDDQFYKLNMGIEKIVFQVLAIRAGVSQNLDFEENRRMMAGTGLKVGGFGLDASYEFAQEKVFQGNMRFSTHMEF